MKYIKDRLSKLETVAGIVPNKNPFKASCNKSFPLAIQDWTTDDLFRLLMGEESLKEKEAKTDWSEWKSGGDRDSVQKFCRELTVEQLRKLIKRIKEQDNEHKKPG